MLQFSDLRMVLCNILAGRTHCLLHFSFQQFLYVLLTLLDVIFSAADGVGAVFCTINGLNMECFLNIFGLLFGEIFFQLFLCYFNFASNICWDGSLGGQWLRLGALPAAVIMGPGDCGVSGVGEAAGGSTLLG